MEAAFLGPHGRKVRCKSCEAIWFQAPVQNTPENTDPAADAPPRFDIESEAKRLMAASKSAARHQSERHLHLTRAMRGWLVLAVSVTCFLSAAAIWRNNVVGAFPAAAMLYQKVNMPVNLRGLVFSKVTSKSRFEEGIPILAIEGEIHNITDTARLLPQLRYSLRDNSSQEIYHWSQVIRHKALPAGGRVKFSARLASPPAEAQHVTVRFSDLEERRAGVRK